MVKKLIYSFALSSILFSPCASLAMEQGPPEKKSTSILQKLKILVSKEKSNEGRSRSKSSPAPVKKSTTPINTKKDEISTKFSQRNPPPLPKNLLKALQEKEEKVEEKKSTYPEILTFEQLKQIVSAPYINERKTTEAVLIDQNTFVSVKNLGEPYKKLQEHIKKGDNLEGHRHVIQQAHYTGSTVATKGGEDNFDGALVTYHIMAEDKSENSPEKKVKSFLFENRQVELILSITTSKK